jgi:hypothetical protein
LAGCVPLCLHSFFAILGGGMYAVRSYDGTK